MFFFTILFVIRFNKYTKIYTTLGYIVSLILLNLGHVFRFRIVSRMFHQEASVETIKMINKYTIFSHKGRNFLFQLYQKLFSISNVIKQFVSSFKGFYPENISNNADT